MSHLTDIRNALNFIKSKSAHLAQHGSRTLPADIAAINEDACKALSILDGLLLVSLETAAKAVSAFHTRNGFETSIEEWKECCRNEAKAVLDSVGVAFKESTVAVTEKSE